MCDENLLPFTTTETDLMNRLIATVVAISCFSISLPALGGIVIHTAMNATSSTITIPQGTTATVELFVASDDTNALEINGVDLYLSVSATAPKITSIDATFLFDSINIDSSGILDGGLTAFHNVGQDDDVVFSSSSEVRKFASVTLDAAAATPGFYQLLFQQDVTGGGTFVTEFANSSSNVGIEPTINNGTTTVDPSVGLTIQVTAVPEPSAFLMLGLVGIAGTARYFYSMKRVR